MPNQYQGIAIAVSQAAPDASLEIVNAVSSAVPGLQPSIEKVLAGYGGNVPSVAVTLDQVAQAKTVSELGSPTAPSTLASPRPMVGASPARGPAVGPPYIPLPGTPTGVTPGSSGPVPGGGRNYASP